MLVSPPQRSSIVEHLNRLTPAEGPDAKDAIGKLASAQELSSDDASLLEAIIREQRPLVPIEDDRLRLDKMPQNTVLTGGLEANAQQIATAARGIAGLRVAGLPVLGWSGTCFLVADTLAATARHVVETFASVEGAGKYRFKPGLTVSAHFDSPARAGPAARVVEIVLVHPVLDFALIRLDDVPDGCRPLHLRSDVSAEDHRIVSVIGFVNAGSAASQLFDGQSSTKRVAPGKLAGITHYDFLGAKVLCLKHDCTTATGASGAPLIDIETGHVVGVHFAGSFAEGGFATPASELARDQHVRPQLTFEGASNPPDPLAWNAEWHAALGGESQPEADAKPPAASTREVSRLLAQRFDSNDALFSFLQSLGAGYADAANAQPPPDALPMDQYRAAMVTALSRRNLIDEDFLSRIGFVAEQAVAAKPAPPEAEQRWLSPEQVAAISAKMKLDSFKGMKLRGIVLGSPFWTRLSKNDEILPLQASLAELAGNRSPEARDALIWLLRRLLNEPGNTKAGELEVLRALAGLDAAPPAPIRPYLPEAADIVGISYLKSGLEAAKAVGMVKVQLKGKQLGGSTCWLIAPDLVVTAAHVSNFAGQSEDVSPSDIDPAAFSMEFQSDGMAQTFVAKEIAFIDVGLDIMVLRTKEPVSGTQPLQVRPDTMPAGGGLTCIHHPNLGAKSFSAQGGRMLANDGHEAVYLLATTAGSAGAPVFDRDWKVVAIHRARISYHETPDAPPVDAKTGASAPALVDAIRKSQEQSTHRRRIWREIVGAQSGLRSIDADLTRDASWSTDMKQARPILIELVDDGTPLIPIEGLRQTARTGRIVSALATRDAIRQLSNTGGVISVQASRAAGGMECAKSMPYIGVPAVRQKFAETGDKAIIAVIDNGIDIHHAAFVDDQGRSRILAFWDQQDPRSSVGQATVTMSAAGERMVADYEMSGGALYLREDIELLRGGAAAPPTFPPANRMEHGTVVASVAAGRTTGNGAGDFAGGAAPGASIVAIRYDLDGVSVGGSSGHVQALQFIDHLATDCDLPVVVNISNGMNSGAHDGTSPVEYACEGFTKSGQKPGRVVVKSAGNEMNEARHARIIVNPGFRKRLRWDSQQIRNARNPDSLVERIELWFQRDDDYEFIIRTPQDRTSPPINLEFAELNELLPNGNRISATYHTLRSENAMAMLEILISKGNLPRVESGVWSVEIKPNKPGSGKPIDAWIEALSNRRIMFLDGPDNACTITIPGTTEHVITVGAVAPIEYPYPYANSSMGPTAHGIPKPDLVAPGVSIVGARAGTATGTTPLDGTSLSAPHVTGALALVMSARRKKAGKTMFQATLLKAGLLDAVKTRSKPPDPQTGHGLLDAEAFFEFMDKLQ